MTDDRDRQPIPRQAEPGGRHPGETLLIWFSVAAAVVVLVASAALWLKFGETVYAARVIALLQNCL
jgi:hypothetical protein